MSDFTGFRRRTNMVADRVRLGKWLRERSIDDALAAAPVNSATPGDSAQYAPDPAKLFNALPSAAICPVRLAQVRLVRPGLAAAARDRLLYLVVLGRPARGVWLAVPFGRYTTAAVPGEIERPGASVPLRVVCLWNARRLADEWLRKCLFAMEISDTERRLLAAALRALKRGTPLPPPLRPHAGPPLFHPLDSRHNYLDEEREALESVMAGSQGAGDGPGTVSSGANEAWTPSALPLAAEGANGYGSVRYYDAADGTLRLRLLARFPSHTWLAQAIDSKGGVTAAFDGWRLLNGAGVLSAPLRGGETVLSADSVDAPLQLVSPDGKTQALTERR